MSSPTPDDSDAGGELAQEYHLCRLRAVTVAPLVFGLAAAALLWLAWRMLDPNLTFKPGHSYGRGSGKGALLIVLLTVLPVWARVPLMLSFVGYFIRLGFHQIRYAFDDVPDFVIGPEGISGLDELGYCSIPWSDVSLIDIRPAAIRIYGPERKAHWLARLIVGRRIMVLYTRWFFKAPSAEILAAIRYYRPDLWLRAQKV